jgi:hypothetical protein
VSAFCDRADLDEVSRASVSLAVETAQHVEGLGHDRELAESGVTGVLGEAVDRSPGCFAGSAQATVELRDEALRTSFARTFYNDTVRDALTIRDRRIVRWLHLAGTAPHPVYFEMDDEPLPEPPVSTRTADSKLRRGPTIDW